MKLKPVAKLSYHTKPIDRKIVEWAIKNLEVCPDIEGYQGEAPIVLDNRLWLIPNTQPPEKVTWNKLYWANRRVCFFCDYRCEENLEELSFVAVIHKDYQSHFDDVHFAEPFQVSKKDQPNLWRACILAMSEYAVRDLKGVIADNNRTMDTFLESVQELQESSAKITDFIQRVENISTLCSQEED